MCSHQQMEVICQLQNLATLHLGQEPQTSIGQKAGLAAVLIWTLWRREVSLAPTGN
jgi:hypothetical protein